MKNFLNKKSKKVFFDQTFGIDGVWVSGEDPKGTVRVGNIKIDENYGDEDLERLRKSVDNNLGGEVSETSDAVAKYRNYVVLIEKLLEARKNK